MPSAARSSVLWPGLGIFPVPNLVYQEYEISEVAASSRQRPLCRSTPSRTKFMSSSTLADLHNSAITSSRILRKPSQYDATVPRPYTGKDVNEVIRTNLLKILGGRKPENYCGQARDPERLVYVTGGKKGRPVAPRALRYALEGVNAPRLDLIAAIAHKEGLQPYQLLFEDFDPSNAPVVVSKSQQELLERIKEDFAVRVGGEK